MTPALKHQPTELSTQVATHQLLEMWLHGKSPATQKYYRLFARRFLEFVNKPLFNVTVAEVQGFADYLTTQGLSINTQRTMLLAVKSLLSFGQKIEVLPRNVGATLRPPKPRDTLTERILSENQIRLMITTEPNKRNRIALRLLYAVGMRVSTLCTLTWGDLTERGEVGQVTVFGKGGKTQVLLLPKSIWQELKTLRGDARESAPVFPSRKKRGHLSPSQMTRIVRKAAHRVGIKANVSPHWLRHSHATHALERGAPIHLVRETLGHASIATTTRYLHARPDDSSARFLQLD